MTATDKRKALMDASNLIGVEIQKLREALRPISQLTSDLVAAADALLIQSADEISSGEVRKVRHVKTKAGGEVEVESSPKGIVLQAKRKCSVCRQSGHRAQNCPNAHKVKDAEMVRVAMRDAAKKPKRTMKPLSPERKAQLIASLAKARAAKKGKS